MLIALLFKNWRRAFHARGLLFYRLLNVAFQVGVFMGISRAIGPVSFGSDSYAHFVLPALGATELMSIALLAPRTFLETESQLGTLEVLATSSPSLLSLTFLESLWPLCRGLFELLLYVFAPWILVSTHPQPALFDHPALSLAALSLVVGQFWFLGLISAGLLLSHRRGASVNSLIFYLATLLGGVYFPLERLNWPSLISNPSALHAASRILRGEGNWSDLALPSLTLGLLAIAGTKFFSTSLQQARKNGSLSF
jgi:hypothetical protein